MSCSSLSKRDKRASSDAHRYFRLVPGRISVSTTAQTITGELALEGGKPLRVRPFPPWPHFGAEEIEAAAAVLRSGRVNYWTGDQGRAFEQEYAAAAGCRYAVAVTNGTVALELALMALGIGPGDEVIVPARTFIAAASCAAMRGARPVIADMDRFSGTMTVETIKPLLTCRTRAIVAVHLAGLAIWTPSWPLPGRDEFMSSRTVLSRTAPATMGVLSVLSEISRRFPSARTRSCQQAVKAAWSRPTTRICGSVPGVSRITARVIMQSITAPILRASAGCTNRSVLTGG